VVTDLLNARKNGPGGTDRGGETIKEEEKDRRKSNLSTQKKQVLGGVGGEGDKESRIIKSF